MAFPTPHGDKLRALLKNDKLPKRDRARIRTAIKKYSSWIDELERTEGVGEQLAGRLVSALNRYKLWLDLDLVFDSHDNFLYRQKGQLKLDNTVIEEFLPWLVCRVLSDRIAKSDLAIGPTNAFSQIRFESDLQNVQTGGGMAIRSKDHDFALARPLYLKASHREDFGEYREEMTHLAYVAAEIKTNLDKTMFQEASATAYDLKLAIPGSRYFLLCEWLDMSPISTDTTAIEEVIVLRKARRLPANIRAQFSSCSSRISNRNVFKNYLVDHPLDIESFSRFLSHVERLLSASSENERDALRRGWF